MNVKASRPMPVKRITYDIIIALSSTMWTSMIQEKMLTYNIKSSASLNNITFSYPNSAVNDKLESYKMHNFTHELVLSFFV
jgi:hypothetical protein